MREPQEIIFELDGIPPTLNKMMRMHWAKRSKERDKIYWRILLALGKDRFKKLRSPVDCSIVFHVARLTDEDTVAARAKFILDALVKMGVVEDDSPRCLRLFTCQSKTNKRKEQKCKVSVRERVMETDEAE